MSAAGKEAARLQAGGQASIAQLYEGARKEAEGWASAGFTTPRQWKEGVAPAMMAEGKNRLENFDVAIQGQRSGIGRPRPLPKDTPTAPPSFPTGSVRIGKSPQGKDVWQSPDGKKWVE